MPPVGQSPPSLTASQRFCMSPAFKTEPGVQDFGEGLAVFSGAHAVTSAHSLSLCSAPTGTQTGLWLEQCHCRGPLPFINRSLRGRFSRRQLLLPPRAFMLCVKCRVSWRLSSPSLLDARSVKGARQLQGGCCCLDLAPRSIRRAWAPRHSPLAHGSARGAGGLCCGGLFVCFSFFQVSHC